MTYNKLQSLASKLINNIESMLSLKFISSSVRGASALVSNQAASSSTSRQPAKCKPTTLFVQADAQSWQKQQNRQFSVGGNVSRQAVGKKSTMFKVSTPPELIDAQLPEKPKKPITPWIAFVRERKDELLAQRGKMSAPELTSILAREWKQVDHSRYDEEFKRKHEQYQKLVEEYENSLTNEHRDLLDLQRTLKRETKAAKMLRKTNPPLLPRNPANLYCHERSKQDDFKEMLKYKKPSQLFSDIFKEYRSLSESEKQKYINMQEEDKARFQQEFIAWYEGIQANENLTKVARDQADVMRARLKALNYI